MQFIKGRIVSNAERGLQPRHIRFVCTVILNYAETMRTGQHAPSGYGVFCAPK
ncbi:hypothetical protein [Methyloglobulus sp.]|uniref:hypothetical protein n=1 Tax=Methyloglobulus sp. TaxID=2518622 RepID=UPI0032B858C0